jgi:aspartyl-tRNA synthetase
VIRTHSAGTLRREHESDEVVLAGWVARRRDHGGVAFVDVRDGSGIVQVVLRAESGEEHPQLRDEACVKVTGTVRVRPEGNENPDLPTGEIEVAASDVEVLSTADPLPFQVEDIRQDVGEESRLRWRYLDLRRAGPAQAIRMRAHVTRVIRQVMDAHGFPTSRRRTSRAARLKVPATSSYPSGCSPGTGTPCRSRRSCSSSC